MSINLIRVQLPAAEGVEYPLFQSEDGKRWKLAGTDANGGWLFVPEHLDPAQVARWVWAKEDYLVEACGVMSPVGGAS
ncbi:hypothetical protein ACIOEX_01175 [Streptomyces sp. NPDC087850]|uniref:hypothetical protein n=1 Tax=Streptomyces sp. NPDC087850 TaxID=3365809 RepID=UPI0038007854